MSRDKAELIYKRTSLTACSLFLLPHVSSMNLHPVCKIWQRKCTLQVYCTLGVSAAGDRITTLLSLGAGVAPRRQLSRWSTCSKLSAPNRGSRGPPLSPILRCRGGVWQGRQSLPSVPSWGPFVLLFHSKNTLIRTRECLFRKLKGSNRTDIKS